MKSGPLQRRSEVAAKAIAWPVREALLFVYFVVFLLVYVTAASC